MLEYLVLYNSQSGNTKNLAASVFSALPGNSKDLIDITTEKVYQRRAFISSASEVSNFIQSLTGKDIALFGTCGMGNSPEYYKMIEQNVSIWINDTCRYLGAYLCQGKMPLQVRNKYETMRTDENSEQIDMFIRNFDMAMTHPDTEDYQKAQEFAIACISSADSSI